MIYLLTLHSLDSTYMIFGSFSAAMFFFVWFFIPETKGIALERMDELFGDASVSTDNKLGDSGSKADTTRVEVAPQTGDRDA